MAIHANESILEKGDLVTLRLWKDEPPVADAPEESRPYETVGYVISGSLELVVDGKSTELVAGDSYRVPRDAPHRYIILERLTAVEAIAPGP